MSYWPYTGSFSRGDGLGYSVQRAEFPSIVLDFPGSEGQYLVRAAGLHQPSSLSWAVGGTEDYIHRLLPLEGNLIGTRLDALEDQPLH
jgi:hypothetical protein